MRENHPKRRQLRAQKQRLSREKASRAGYPAILVICEGRETEPNYIRGLCDARGINRANVTIVPGDAQTSALQLVHKARRRFEFDRDFDEVFVLCDCAGEDLTVAQTLAAQPMRSTSGEWVSVRLIVSRPCFEFWLLLHFEYSARPFPDAEHVVELLRRYVTDYEKSDRQIFAKVAVALDRAIDYATRVKRELAAVDADSPDTDMPAFIRALDKLRRRGV